MYRFKIWGIGFAPIILGLFISIFAGFEIGMAIMGLSVITFPAAVKMEESLLDKQNPDYKNGSPAGNALAKFLGVLVVGGAIWLFGFILIDVIKLNG